MPNADPRLLEDEFLSNNEGGGIGGLLMEGESGTDIQISLQILEESKFEGTPSD